MKKMILVAVAMLSMSTAFAGNEDVKAVRKAYNMTVNYSRLAKALNLTSDQYDVVEYVHSNFCNEVRRASYASSEKRQERFDRALRKDLGSMRSVLNRNQYRTYVMLLNATLVNRGLK
ncbi:MAG: hypothetical protein J5953_04105 [Prevotella sp.]|jgi:biopolymer transport protein ExbB/TolQ|nr:hypothetical protein [Prevotella sp.]